MSKLPAGHHYRAIIFDLDGTAVPNSITGMPSPRLIAAVAAAKPHLHLVAATGRQVRYTLPVLTALELTDPCIISGGSILMDPVTETVLRYISLPAATVRTILNILAKHPYTVTLRDEQVDLTQLENHRHLIENVEIIYVSRVPEAAALALKPILEAIPGISVNVVLDWSGQDYAITITHEYATKEHAVNNLLERLNLNKSDVIGVGDGGNDIHLFAAVGLKIAMGNASPELKAAADIIAPTVDEDGLAQIIEQYTHS
jgi:HAD superfamily hydrolase (TIGR01484 family)